MDKKTQVKRIFDSISHKYDFLNHFLSAGVDFYWRKKALKLSQVDSNTSLLDVACGTGDFSISAKKFGVNKIIGLDLSKNMLSNFNEKVNWSKGNLVQSVAEFMPFKNNSFTNITVAFGVRNFYDIKKGFQSFYNVLRDNGKVTILEFRLPESGIIKSIYLFYFDKILPLIGKIISKDKEAYTYLPESVNEFDSKIDLQKILSEVGFKNITKHSLTFGIVQVVIAKK
ncbi:MAG: bifunctional demethylmenaquinone methyltransferase/2-methoxy-6-polyprenyl-1,4-benzoquinol methylase UbiE [Ignavibacteriales bacterium]|nr:bifunctional demethylmenaquinone methyltransferase/2-methoxy-6-polyprenyl-1,4-benzoquinol methylase UbiE [Ignavibacteriales bacterium]MCB9217983.1 bifunctional demethylmenaquinone methyltransferase/2-methoxy-6-polyprenyl-1,4-benzoquinol methylase UbiE [Ignavibacteriales bacterium]